MLKSTMDVGLHEHPKYSTSTKIYIIDGHAKFAVATIVGSQHPHMSSYTTKTWPLPTLTFFNKF